MPWAIKENSDTSSGCLRGSARSPKRRQLQNEGLRNDDGCYDAGLRWEQSLSGYYGARFTLQENMFRGLPTVNGNRVLSMWEEHC